MGSLARNTISKIQRRSFTKLSYHHQLGEEPLRPLTFGQQLEESASKWGDRKAIISVHQKKSLTFQETLDSADKLAAGLKTLGLKKRDRVGVWAPNLIEWYVTKMACARAGLIMVALNPAYQPPEMEYCINKVQISALICAEKLKTQVYHDILTTIDPIIEESEPGKIKSSKIPSLKTVIIMSDERKRGAFTYEEINDRGTSEGINDIRKNQKFIGPDDPYNIQFTSGTTGKPKAALLSHFQINNNGFYVGKRSEFDRKHHVVCVQNPFFHAYGTVITISSALNFGATLVCPSETFNPDKSLDAIKQERCTLIHGTPTMYVDLVHKQEQRNEDISPEIAVTGGAICSSHLLGKMLQHLKVKKVKSVYGLTETTAVVFQSLPGEDEEKATTTVGHVSEHTEVKVIDSDGNIVPIGTPGELCIRSYCTMLGYWEDEMKTKEMIGWDKWLRTGDQFVLLENGYGKVVGRIKEMIIRGGENIFPREIEEFLNSHPNILETHVIGLPHERLGEEVCACVRLKPDKTFTHKELVDFCKGKLAYFKIPSQLRIIDDFPKTISGKIQKFKLLELAKHTENV